MKTFPPITMGLERPRPGRSTFQLCLRGGGNIGLSGETIAFGTSEGRPVISKQAGGCEECECFKGKLEIHESSRCGISSYGGLSYFFAGGGSVPRVGGRQAVLGEKCSACRVAYAHLKLPLISPGFLLFVLAELDEEGVFTFSQLHGEGVLINAHTSVVLIALEDEFIVEPDFPRVFASEPDFSSSGFCCMVGMVGVGDHFLKMAIGLVDIDHAICIGSLEVAPLHVAILTGIGFCEVDFFFWWICDGKAFALCVVEGSDNLPMHEKAEVSG